MKTKTFFLLCLLMGIGLTQLSGQTRTFSYKYDDAYGVLELPVYCSTTGEEVDRIIMDDYSGHILLHLNNGVPVWGFTTLMGECHSKTTSEVFTYKEIDPSHLVSGTTYTVIYNLKGNQGHHYLGTMEVKFTDWELILDPLVIRAICN
jgi:hypothetical protein